MNSKESIFDNYVMDCQSEDAGDLSKSKPASLLPIPTSAPYWTSSGTAGKYLWRSLTSVFSPEVHKLDDQKKRYNHYHDACRYKGGTGIMRLLLDSIDYDPEISQILRNFQVVNSNVLYTGRPEKVVIDGLVEGLQDAIFRYDDILYLKESNRLGVYSEVVQNSDLIYPDLLVNQQSIKQYVAIASALCKAGARTCVGIFVTHLVPNERGQYPTCLPQDMGLPIIKGLSMDELTDMASIL
jgi:hypothetical protein